ncbi:hypothetical protein [Streptomyces sp. NPDC050263]|uniref:hypothetical protein n=1 Tax=Streptomyces sp. NPDC050263 TaxID=3155037 RepID=UPI00343CB4EB
MDQGIAAVLAGVAGLAGAGIGGLATAYGARIGAQKSMEAVQVQVRKQSEAEHLHWAREQRRQTCIALTDTFGLFARSVVSCNAFIYDRRPLPLEEIDRITAEAQSLVIQRGHVELWGPLPLTEAATALTDAAEELRRSTQQWPAVLDRNHQSEMTRYIREHRSRVRPLKDLRVRFTSVAHRILTEPA